LAKKVNEGKGDNTPDA